MAGSPAWNITVRRTGFYREDLAYIHDAGFSDPSRRLAPAIVRLLHRHGRSGGTKSAARPCQPVVVEFGCGSGVIIGHLVEQGYQVLGIDASPAMIRIARLKVPEATFRVGTTAAARIPPCRAVLALGEVLSYVTPDATPLRGFFARAFAALAPDGILLFDFLESADGRTYPSKSRAGADWAVVSRAEADRHGRLLTRHITTLRKIGSKYRRSEEIHRVRIFTRAAIGAALRRAGFTVRMQQSLGGVPQMRSNVLAIAVKKSS